jgi:peptide/nickel transport system substrate-binding protein
MKPSLAPNAIAGPRRVRRALIVILQVGLRLTVPAVVILLVIEALAWSTVLLSGSDQAELDSILQIESPVRDHDIASLEHHTTREPPSGESSYKEAPALRERVACGALPPVEERLPEEPLVVEPPEQIGPYGGCMSRVATGIEDVGVVVQHRLGHESLLRWDAMAQEVRPNLATKVDVGPEGRQYTFHLRRGVRWSDGEPFTADDVLFWHRYVLLCPELTPSVGPEFSRSGQPVRLEKLDDYTIRFEFDEPQCLFRLHIASEIFGGQMTDHAEHYLWRFHPDAVAERKTREDPTIQYENARQEALADLDEQAQARGFLNWYQLFQEQAGWRNPDAPRVWAWILKDEPVSGKPILTERNPYYWKVDPQGHQLPYIDEVKFRVFESPEAMSLQAISGNIDMQGRHVMFEDYPLLMAHQSRGHYRIRHWIYASATIRTLAINLNHRDPALRKLFHDRRFRIALSLALDRDELNEYAFYGIGSPRQVSPPSSSKYAWPEYAKAYTEYDPDRANALLDELGLEQRDSSGGRLLPNGEPLRIEIDTSAHERAEDFLQLVANHWTSVGVKTEVNSLARQLFYERKRALMHDVGVWGGGDEIVPLIDPRWFIPFSEESLHAIAYARWYRSGGEVGEKPPPALERCIELYRQVYREPDETRQKALFREILELNRHHLWVIGTVSELPFPVIVSNRMRNVPESAVYGWVMKSPSNTAPECWAIDEGKAQE